MRYGIELNGVANLTLLLNDLLEEHVPMQTKYEDLIKEQLKLLELYMIAYADARNNNEEPPAWHEVRDNPTKYKLNSEK